MTLEAAVLFIDRSKVTEAVAAHLGPEVSVMAYDEVCCMLLYVGVYTRVLEGHACVFLDAPALLPARMLVR